MDSRRIKKALLNVNSLVLLSAIVVLIITFSLLSPYFLTLTNLRVILESMAILTILALGEHSLLVAGEIDISFPAVLGLSAATAALVSPNNAVLLIVLGLAAAASIGVINGFFTVKVGISSFLVTLATETGVNGVVLLLCNYRSVLLEDNLLPQIFYGRVIGHVPTSVFWMLTLAVVVGAFLRYTKFGRWVFATGGNNHAASLMGIPTQRVRFSLFVLSSILAGIAGLITASRSLAARPLIGEAYMMPVIAAPILGGAVLTGGRGSVVRTILGCVVLTIITDGTNLLGLEPAYQDIFMAVILIGSLSFQGGKEQVKELFRIIARK